MRSRVCVVTGGTSGIGTETARGLAARGATVLLTGRSKDRAREIAASIGRETATDVHGFGADLSSLAEVRGLADRILARHDAIHVLVNNAGLWHPDRRLSRDGYEETFAVNHLAPFLLTRLLEPALEKGAREAGASSRVVAVSSRLHEKEKRFDFDDPMSERRYDGLRAYRQSKLANVMFANELARRAEGTGITSNSLHPGDVATNVVRDSRFLSWGLATIARFFVKTPEEGARTSIHVATAPELEKVSGRYFRDCREAKAAAAALDTAACARLWALSDELVDA